MKNYLQITIGLMALMLSSCEENISFLAVKFDDASIVASNVTYYSATLNCQFETINEGNDYKKGYIYFEYADYPEYFSGERRAGHYWMTEKKDWYTYYKDRHSVPIRNLNPRTRYYFAPVFEGYHHEELFRGAVRQFSTTAAPPGPAANQFWLEQVHGSWTTSTWTTKSGYNIFQSSGSYHVAYGYDLLKVSFQGPASFTVYYGSYAETTCDYVCLSSLDDASAANWSSSNTSGTSVYTSSGSQYYYAPNLSRYYSTTAEGTHFFYIMYKKDGSVDSNNDRGYLGLPNNYSYIWK